MLALPFIIIIDLLVFNGSLYFCKYAVGLDIIPQKGMFIINLIYLVCVLAIRPISHKRFVRIEKIASRSFETSLVFFIVYALLIKQSASFDVNDFHYCIGVVITSILLFLSRAFSRFVITSVRMAGRGAETVVFVGAGKNLAYLYERLISFLGKSFVFLGYFNDKDSIHLPEQVNRLGTFDDVLPWLEKNHPDIVYCNLPASRGQEIIDIIRYCEKHLIHFRTVANVRDFMHRTLAVDMIDDMPVMSIMREPLASADNRFIKRTFDIIFSSIFLITCFWWIYIIVAIVTKITMPGPIFFCQKRNGILGKEFTMIKFRSMKVNSEADTLQATKDDPRKTWWGNVMRKTNIDELPQFINVLLGDMSVVGPRPHMVKHTEQYSAMIDKYMVRHWVKPGITGWAQVTGARGETEELWQMENRIQKDIWYIEHWSVWLDLRIIFMTIWNVITGDKQAY